MLDTDPRPTEDNDVSTTLEETVIETPDPAATMVEDVLLPGARLTVGGQVGAYEILRRVGGGGMGEVYAARRSSDGRTVALKTLSDVHATRLYRFKREFRALADVKHDNLVALEELVVLADGRAFFTMELIDGVDFVAYVRGDTPKRQLPNLVRLERALRQVIAGIEHLHKHRCVHRDIKPSNVLVTREGRVVILDFGVISELTEVEDGLTGDGQMLGTPAYMAPEQAGGQVAGPAADYYAVGTMLFECLTGALPFSGSVLDILIEKRHGEVPDPQALLDAQVTQNERAGVLLDLCRQTMAVEPEARPTGPALLLALGEAADTTGSMPIVSAARVRERSQTLPIARTTFVGRTHELSALDAALRTVCDELTPVTVHVRGNSGQGKSTLISRFLGSAREGGSKPDDLVILRGRCLERESVPYKGIDSVVDALSIYLRRLDEVDAARLQPRHLAPLLQLFPVLDDAWESRARTMDLDPGELRRRGFASLREVFARVAERHPLVVYIDDFQWADVDSARLLTELMRPPDPPAMLLLITYRDEVDQREVLQLLTEADAIEGRDVRELEIGPLSNDEARELAATLLRERATAKLGIRSATTSTSTSTSTSAAGATALAGTKPGESTEPAVSAEALARRAQGNPFYIGQMVLGDDAHNSDDASLDRLVARRIVALEPAQRRVLATVAVAAGPTPLPVILQACAAIDPDATIDEQTLTALLGANLLIRQPPDDLDTDERIETAHDRIRFVAVGELSPTELRATHRALGETFEALGGGESEALAEHFNVAGDPVRALDYTEKAATDAASALAFERAAQLYRRALGLLPADAPAQRRRALELALAEQLVDLGRGAEAAHMLISLAGHAETPHAARELRRRAASELVKAGYIDEGMDTITPVLRELGIWQPRGAGMAVLGTLWNRAIMGLRGYGFRKRSDAEVDPDLLERIDTLLATKTGLSHNEAIFAGYQQSRAIRLALRAGEPRRLIRCLVHDAAIYVAIGKTDKGRALLQTARELVEDVVETEYRRVVDYVDANHQDHQGHWPEAAARFERLHTQLDETPNAGWIRGASTVQWMLVRKLLGQFALLRAELPERVATARDLGVRHEQVSLGCLSAFVHAVDGQLEPAWRALDDARERWHPSQITFQTILLELTEVEIALLAGEPLRAVSAAERVLGDFRAKLVATMMPSHVELHELRGRSRVRAALDGHDVTRSLALVRRDLVTMRKSHKPQVPAQALAIEAAVASCEGDWTVAEARWREAKAEFERLAMAGHVAAVGTRLASLGDEAAGLAARAYFDTEGILDVDRVVDALAPGRTGSKTHAISRSGESE